ncbi:permease [Azohydromonas sp. G-1-1-14]|uniref:Permease n=1 Tax=Azohydromonas caseinilytica TaxID=2728836 RepID=A0A848FL02_9BURK|nr:permease [Azohydromonas caseinilytica]
MVQAASFVLVAVLCALSLTAGLLPGLLAVCVSFLMTRALTRMPTGPMRLPPWLAATLVIVAPLLGLSLLMLNAKGYSLLAVQQYQALLNHLANTILEMREKLPPEIVRYLPEGVAGIQELLAAQLRTQASHLASMGRTWLHGLLLAYVGLIIGALLATRRPPASRRPLSAAIAARAFHFIDAFRQIVAAQFWIAMFNAVLTALFLLGALPLFGIDMPYDYALVGMTFVFGLVPIVGNLVVNVVMTLVGVSVSPFVGLACLAFLIGIHKAEYFINARVVGSKTSTGVWELLAAMFAAETVFGVPGLVAAPLYYAYVKKELGAAGLV